LAAADAASDPACPAPTTITSYSFGNIAFILFYMTLLFYMFGPTYHLY
jgi:hypothetical protein